MKANELMIGDWVIFGDEPLKVQHVYNNGYDDVVAEIVEDGTNEYGVYEEIKDVPVVYCSPIPLTPEILEKNGFVFDCDFWTIANPRYNNVRMVTYYSTDDYVADAFLGHWAFDENYAIDYVHELQHALRLCGLNELADNFKVYGE